MKKTLYIEVALLTILTGLLVLLADPLNIVMKLMLTAVVASLLALVYAVKFVIIWREKPQDERYLQHRFYSSWWSYAMASLVLAVGVVYQALHGGIIDMWLVAGLAVMFIVKIVTLVYLEVYK